ncbi:hypothetical protein Tsubulata_027322 [Turnera subulata]|uniref:Uncharacterized protein n=1 Tax=Turnera subulata TaxID=218843 RepID=A0A9Q0G3C4_9ROSI|nr:hypothetical protein Tsubulata_027322 [Turnera subulata]
MRWASSSNPVLFGPPLIRLLGSCWMGPAIPRAPQFTVSFGVRFVALLLAVWDGSGWSNPGVLTASEEASYRVLKQDKRGHNILLFAQTRGLYPEVVLGSGALKGVQAASSVVEVEGSNPSMAGEKRTHYPGSLVVSPSSEKTQSSYKKGAPLFVPDLSKKRSKSEANLLPLAYPYKGSSSRKPPHPGPGSSSRPAPPLLVEDLNKMYFSSLVRVMDSSFDGGFLEHALTAFYRKVFDACHDF